MGSRDKDRDQRRMNERHAKQSGDEARMQHAEWDCRHNAGHSRGRNGNDSANARRAASTAARRDSVSWAADQQRDAQRRRNRSAIASRASSGKRATAGCSERLCRPQARNKTETKRRKTLKRSGDAGVKRLCVRRRPRASVAPVPGAPHRIGFRRRRTEP